MKIKKIILLIFFAASSQAATKNNHEKWEYIPPEPASMVGGGKKEYKSFTLKSDERDTEVTRTGHSVTHSEYHDNITTFYIEKTDPITNETDIIEEGVIIPIY